MATNVQDHIQNLITQLAEELQKQQKPGNAAVCPIAVDPS